MADVPYPYSRNKTSAPDRIFTQRFGLCPIDFATSIKTSSNPSTVAKTTDNQTWYVDTNLETGNAYIPLSGIATLYARCPMGGTAAAAHSCNNTLGIFCANGSWLKFGTVVNPESLNATDTSWSNICYGNITNFGGTSFGSPIIIRLLSDANNKDRDIYANGYYAIITYTTDWKNGSELATGSVYYAVTTP